MADLTGQALEAAISKLSEMAVTAIHARLKRHPLKLSSTPATLTNALRSHLTKAAAWSGAIAFKDLGHPKSLFDVYVDLELEVVPRGGGRAVNATAAPVSSLVSAPGNIVLLGDVGGGKTTSLKRLMQFHLDEFARDPEHKPLPLFCILRSLRENESLSQRIATDLDLALDQPTRRDTTRHDQRNVVKETRLVVEAFLSRTGARLFLDGLDELPAKSRALIVDELRELLLITGPANEHLLFSSVWRRNVHASTSVFLTCRSGAFDYGLDNTEVFELRPLSPPLMDTFIRRWLGSEDRSRAFKTQISKTPYIDVAVRPLTLVHLCVIFDRFQRIPDKPKSVYRKVVQLLLEDWDAQRSIHRDSAYANFESDQKLDFLTRIAYEMSNVAFSHDELQAIYRGMCSEFGLPKNDAGRVAREIESHTGLIIQTGLDTYEFAHKSLKEYLSAAYVVTMPTVPHDEWFRVFPSECAIAVALSGNSSGYFAALVERSISGGDPQALEVFLRRIVVERPDFACDVTLGAAILLINHRVIMARHEGEAEQRIIEMLSALATLPNIVESLASAIRFYRLVRTVPPDKVILEEREESNSLLDALPSILHVHSSMIDVSAC